MRILLLSAYDAASHRQWRQGLIANLPEHQWTTLSLEPRFFAWRIRGNAFSWFSENLQTLQQPYDLILATSMVDLATLKGIVPQLATTPAILYFHENQFAYPESGHAKASVEAQITSIYSAIASTRLLFNSAYNQHTFLSGAKALLNKLPDHAPTAAIDALAEKSRVLPVPIEAASSVKQQDASNSPVTLLWNHRWEYDKGPERLLLVLRELSKQGLDFRIHLLGQQFRQQPESFAIIKTEFSDQIISWGYIESRQQYLQTLQASDIVFSTALHDFQGLAMLEAMRADCIPVAPNRLAYPEYIPASLLSESHPESAEDDARAIATTMMHVAEKLEFYRDSKPDLSRMDWPEMAELYREALKL